MKTKETSTKRIYVTVVTSGLTMLVNKVAVVLQPNEDIFDACSKFANDIAKQNGLEWSNVLVQYFNHYSDGSPQFDGWRIPAKPKSTREQAIAWWNSLPHQIQGKYWVEFRDITFTPSTNPSNLTGREIEQIYNNKVLKLKRQVEWQESHLNRKYSKPNQKQYSQEEVDRLLDQQAAKTTAQMLKSNQKQFKQFDESLFKAYIDKFSDEDKLKAFEILFEKSKKWDGINNSAPFYMAICRAYNAGKQAINNQHEDVRNGKEWNTRFVSSDNYFKEEFGFK